MVSRIAELVRHRLAPILSRTLVGLHRNGPWILAYLRNDERSKRRLRMGRFVESLRGMYAIS